MALWGLLHFQLCKTVLMRLVSVWSFKYDTIQFQSRCSAVIGLNLPALALGIPMIITTDGNRLRCVCVCVLLVMRFSSALSELVVLGDAGPHRSLCVYVNVCLDVFACVQTSQGSWEGSLILILITISQSVSNSLKILFYIVTLQIWLGWAAEMEMVLCSSTYLLLLA